MDMVLVLVYMSQYMPGYWKVPMMLVGRGPSWELLHT